MIKLYITIYPLLLNYSSDVRPTITSDTALRKKKLDYRADLAKVTVLPFLLFPLSTTSKEKTVNFRKRLPVKTIDSDAFAQEFAKWKNRTADGVKNNNFMSPLARGLLLHLIFIKKK